MITQIVFATIHSRVATLVALLASVTAWVSISNGETFQVQNEVELSNAIERVKPGDRIEMSDREWKDAQIVFAGSGTSGSPITLAAATPGQAILTGKSTLKIAGEFLCVTGLRFRNLDEQQGDPIQFRLKADRDSHFCRLTNCSIVGDEKTSKGECRWVGIYGSQHRIDHCHFEGKTSKGATVVVWLADENSGKHQLDHNYFGPREKLGTNGGETLRVGDSQTSMLQAECIVEQNWFERCNGEAECISNKSCDNVYRANVFHEVGGTLTLRHGNRCLVEENCFFGNDQKGTGGIRVIGEDHIVRKNYLERLTGDDARSAISLMMGIPNSPIHRYFQVKRARVENNILVACKHPILVGLKDDEKASLPPVDSIFVGNKAVSKKVPVIEARCSLAGITWEKNQFDGTDLLGSDWSEHQELTQAQWERKLISVERPKSIARDRVGVAWFR